jgi:hypothetical protein
MDCLVEVDLRDVFLVGCSEQKSAHELPAGDLYLSPRFLLAKSLAERFADHWLILSASHGAIPPSQTITPYDLDLDKFDKSRIDRWNNRTFEQLRGVLRTSDRITFLANATYSSALAAKLRIANFAVREPLLGLDHKSSISWMQNALGRSDRGKHLGLFYTQLKRLWDELPHGPSFAKLSPKEDFPIRGVYFFFEPRETRFFDGATLRVVRVGTHAVSSNSKSTLWGRLKTHRGTQNGLGNHRSSIMRLHVGAALQHIHAEAHSETSWGRESPTRDDVIAKERSLERQVSQFIGQMSVLWLAISDPPSKTSDRAYIEQNAIALLAGRDGIVDFPCSDWMGLNSPSIIIRESGLWNLNYVGATYDSRFMDVFSAYVDSTLGQTTHHTDSIAPKDWHAIRFSGRTVGQLDLFGKEYNET